MTITNTKLAQTVTVATLAVAMGLPATADNSDLVVENNNYRLQLLTQIFDGQQEFSHSQTSAVARMRKGDESYTLVNFGDGAVYIDTAAETSASHFKNTTGIEAEFKYNYKTKTLSGSNQVSSYFNSHVRQYLENTPALGQDQRWVQSVSLSDLNVPGTNGGQVKIELMRDYFTHDGKEYVLLHYKVPAFNYTSASGQDVIQWGEGVSLSDPGFGEIYWNASLQRAVALEADGTKRPYRYAKTLAGLTRDGAPLVDPRRISEVQPYFETFYGPTKTEVIGFVDGGLPDQSAVMMSANLDVMALSLAEGSANEAPQVSGQHINGNNGQTVANNGATAVGNDDTGPAAADNAATKTGYVGKVKTASQLDVTTAKQIYEPKARALESEHAAFETKSKTVANEMLDASNEMEELSEAIEFEKQAQQKSIDLNSNTTILKNAQNKDLDEARALLTKPNLTPTENKRLIQLQKDAVEKGKVIARFEAQIDALEGSAGIIDDLLVDLENAGDKLLDLERQYDGIVAEGERLARATVNLEAERKVLEAQGVVVSKAKFVDKLPTSVKNVIASQAGKLAVEFGDELLTTAGDVANIYTTAKAGYNVIDAATHNQSSGDVRLVRSYGTGGAVVDLGLDIGGLFVSAATGDLRGFVSDGVAISAGSLADIFVSAKALKDFHVAHLEIMKQTTALAKEANRRDQVRSDTDLKRWELTNAILDSNLSESDKDRLLDQAITVDVNSSSYEDMLSNAQANRDTSASISISDSQARSQALLEERREARADQAEADRQRAQQIAEQNARIRAQNEYNRGAQDRLENALKSDYPTAPPRETYIKDANNDDPYIAPSDVSDSDLDIVDLTTGELTVEQRKFLNKQELDEYQATLFAARAEEERQRQEERAQRIADGKKNPITWDPVVFDPVTWEAPEWEAPEWEPPTWAPPEFDNPVGSIIDFTQFDGSEDDHWLGFASVMAYQYDNMSGTVETDLTKWEEFIALHSLRKLEQLARQAGYPNLASALNDWENLVAKANDSGFRQWAGRQPACYMACTNIQGLWTQKLSQLALGDLINESADLFSTGGFTDISVGSLLLTIFFRDFALEDGDAIRIVVSQFGLELFNSSFVLTNAGQSINIPLRPGVAAVTVTALNTGEFPPNTAAVSIGNVTGGESEQEYSLEEGEDGTLRVNARK